MKIFSLKNLNKISEALIGLISIALIGFVLIANLIRTCHIDSDEKISFSSAYSYLILIPVILLIIFLYIHIAKSFDAVFIFKAAAITYIIAGAFIIFNSGDFLHGDASTVWNIAYKFLHHDFTALNKDGYIGYFPYQLGLVTYDLILHIFTHNVNVFFTLNLLYVLIINWFGYKITSELFDNIIISKLVIFLEFAFLPQLFFIMFAYGTIPGFCCLVISFYYCIRIYKEYRLRDTLLLILFSSLAVLLKPNYKIGIMAMIIILILKQAKSKMAATPPIKYVLISAILLACTALPCNLLTLSYSKLCGIQIDSGIPITSFIAMGTDLDNQVIRGPGWYDNSIRAIFSDAGCDSAAASKISIDKIKNNIKASTSEPKRAASFYWRKITSTWCDPFFQSLWSGPGYNGKVSRHLQSLYCGWKAQKLASLFCKAYVVIILTSSLGFALMHRKQYPFSNVFYLYFIGGFIFHLISETKSQYVYMYVFSMLPLAAYQLNIIAERFKALLGKKIV